MSLLIDKLKLLETKQGPRPKSNDQCLRVYYGWRKLNKAIKRESLAVIFMNGHPGPRFDKDGHEGVTRYINVAYSRVQTDGEASDHDLYTQMYSIYEIFMDDKHIQGSLERALKFNYDADKNNVSEVEREIIRKKLREAYLASHPDYHEPRGLQLFIDFNY